MDGRLSEKEIIGTDILINDNAVGVTLGRPIGRYLDAELSYSWRQLEDRISDEYEIWNSIGFGISRELGRRFSVAATIAHDEKNGSIGEDYIANQYALTLKGEF